MKKYFILFFFCLVSFQAFSQEPSAVIGAPIMLQVSDPYNPIKGGVLTPKSPTQVPLVSIDNHTIYLYDVDYDLTLEILDEEEQTVYTVFIAANTASIVLPSSLQGDYWLVLYPGSSICYVGEVSL